MSQFPSISTRRNTITADYDVLRHVLGVGISGKVRRCIRRSDNKDFALKILRDNQKARREVGIHYYCAKQCSSVVDVECIYENMYGNEKCLLLVMEFMSGGELFSRIRERGDQPFTEREAACIMKKVCKSVLDLHKLNIAHRDLKPENYLYSDKSDDASLKLTDFGFARLVMTDKPLTTPCYTPYYAAPEVIAHEQYDKSCDMWSIGVIMYILLCGYPPFYSYGNAPLSPGMKKRIRSGDYSFPDAEWGHISDAAKLIIRRLLRVKPEERMTIEELYATQWISQCVGVPETPLPTITVMEQEDNWEEIKAGIREALTQIRPDSGPFIKLKAVNQADKNLLLARRKQKEKELTSRGTNTEE